MEGILGLEMLSHSLTLLTGTAIADPLYMVSGEGKDPGALRALVQEKQLAEMTWLQFSDGLDGFSQHRSVLFLSNILSAVIYFIDLSAKPGYFLWVL